jgi:hypothetical protein
MPPVALPEDFHDWPPQAVEMVYWYEEWFELKWDENGDPGCGVTPWEAAKAYVRQIFEEGQVI